MVTLDAGTSVMCFGEEDLRRYQALLTDPSTSTQGLLLTLRKLSVHEISAAHLSKAALLQPSVQVKMVLGPPHALRLGFTLKS